MNIFRLITIILFFIVYKINYAQTNRCIDDVKKVYKEWTDDINKNEGNALYLKYESEAIIDNQNKPQKIESVTELMFDQKNSFFSTTNLTIYEDKKHTVSIMPDKKIIVINEYVGNNYKNEKIQHFKLLKDTMFLHLKVEKCEMLTINNKLYKKVLLKATPYGMKIFKMNTIEFLLDENAKIVKEMKVNYVKEHSINSLRMKILTQDLNYQFFVMNQPALLYVLDHSGKLLTKYKGYQLIDNRN